MVYIRPKRKHRLYIDVAYSKPLFMREALKGLRLVLEERLDLQKAPVWLYHDSPYIDKLSLVELKASEEQHRINNALERKKQ